MKEGDKVKFTVIHSEGTDTYDYKVMHNHLNCDGEDNDIIFDMLSINKTEFCGKHYGYEAKYGDWPECKPGDYAALARTIDALQEICNIKNRTTIDLHGLYK